LTKSSSSSTQKTIRLAPWVRPDQFQDAMRAWRKVFSSSAVASRARYMATSNRYGPRGGARYKCAACGGDFTLGEVQVDHIDPVVPLDTEGRNLSWDTIYDRLLNVDPEDLQILCKKCHLEKSVKENSVRRAHKRERKLSCEDKPKQACDTLILLSISNSIKIFIEKEVLSALKQYTGHKK